MNDQGSYSFFESIPVPPPRRAKKFRIFGQCSLLLVVFLAPFFFLPLTDDPLHVNTFFVVGFFTLIAFICYLGSALDERRLEYPRSWFSLAIISFLITQAISTELSLIPSQSFWGGLAAPDSLAAFIIYALLFFLFSVFFHKNDIPKIGIAAGGGLFILTIINFFHPSGVDFGWGLILGAAVTGLAVVRPGEFRGSAKLLFFMTIVVLIAGLVFLNYQFLWLALAIFIMVLAVLRFGPREHFQYAFAIIVIALFFALVSPRLVSFLPAPQNVRPGITATAIAVQGSLRGKDILVGSGPATFASDFEAFKPASVNQTPFWAQTFNEGHDFAATLLATGGLLNFLLLLVLIILGIQPFLKIQSLDIDLAMVASAVTFLFVSLFLYPASFVGFVILFALLGLIFSGHVHSISFAKWPRIIFFGFSIVILGLAALSLGGIFVAGEQYIAAVLFAQSSQLANSGNLSAAFGKINSAIQLDPDPEYFRGASQIILSEAKALTSSTDPSAIAEVPAAIESAIQSGQNAVLKNSHDPANWGNLGSIYEAAMSIVGGTDDLAFGSYQNAGTLDPSNPTWDVDMARVLVESAALLPANTADQPAIQAKWDSAESILQKAIALKDDYADPRLLLVQLYLEEGNITEAIQRVQELAQQNPLDPGVSFELGYLYYKDNQIDLAEQEFQVATILNPNYANALYFLGLIYDAKGMEPQAMAEFQRILASNPNNTQVAGIVTNLEAGRPALDNTLSTTTSK